MAENSNTLLSYGDVSIKEDVVLNAIEILTAQETQIMNMLPKSVAIATVHSYLVDTLRSVSLNGYAVRESDDFTASATTSPTRLTNIVELLAVPFKVSRTQQRIDHYHGQNELTRQTEKALKDWGNGAEFDLVRSLIVSGLSGTIPKMSGIIEAISKSTNTTAHTSAVQWNATILDGLMRTNWDNSNGDVATDLFVGSKLKADTDAFTQKTNVVINGAGFTGIVRTVTTYETSFGTLRTHTHRYIQQSGDATARALAINPSKLAVAWLQKPFIDKDLARTGDYDFNAVVGQFTLEVHNQDSNWFASGFIK